VLPILDGDRLVGRIDPKYHREKSTLEIRNVYWERGIKPRKRSLEEAVADLATLIGATRIDYR
jgi:uncharacterized protein YcaQ